MVAEVLVPILTALAGPAAAVVCLLVVLYGIYYLVAKSLIPGIRDGFARVMDEHKEDREMYTATIEKITDRLDMLTDTVSRIGQRLDWHIQQDQAEVVDKATSEDVTDTRLNVGHNQYFTGRQHG